MCWIVPGTSLHPPWNLPGVVDPWFYHSCTQSLFVRRHDRGLSAAVSWYQLLPQFGQHSAGDSWTFRDKEHLQYVFVVSTGDVEPKLHIGRKTSTYGNCLCLTWTWSTQNMNSICIWEETLDLWCLDNKRYHFHVVSDHKHLDFMQRVYLWIGLQYHTTVAQSYECGLCSYLYKVKGMS